MKKFALIGEHLSHSLSPKIHKKIYKSIGLEASYDLIEIPSSILEDKFLSLKNEGFSGFNITIPYKERLLPLIDRVEDKAREIGSINTIKFESGKTIGYNTDYYGFEIMMEKYKPISGFDYLILGYGGASKPIIAYLSNYKARNIYICSRKSEKYSDYTLKSTNIKFVSYEEIYNISGKIIINTTPVGMVPNIDESPVSDMVFENFDIAIDIIYNPRETKFLKSAKKKGLIIQNGNEMLINQAVKAVEIWLDKKINPPVYLVGLPGCGKTSIGKILAEKLDYNFIDLDEYIEKLTNTKIKDLFLISENHFRNIEARALKDISNMSNTIVATGGGVILRKENRDLLLKSKQVFYIHRDLKNITSDLDIESRPVLNKSDDIYSLYEKRSAYYEEVKNYKLINNKDLNHIVNKIYEILTNNILSNNER